MRKFIFIAFFSLLLSIGLLSCGLHSFDELSDSKIVEALQEALALGSETAANNLKTPCENLGECTTGYLGNKLVEIALPKDVKARLDKVDALAEELEALPPPIILAIKTAMSTSRSTASADFSNFRGLSNKIKETLNRGAEKAAPESVDLFKNAIFGMSFSDARSILFGNNDSAATSYLKKTTFDDLQGVFGPILENCLEELKLNSFWKPIASSYNSLATAYKSSYVSNALSEYNFLTNSKVKLPGLPYDKLGEDLSGDLSMYATGKALDGLFYMVGVQEAKLREDPWGTVRAVGGFISDAVGDLLGDVFSKAKEG